MKYRMSRPACSPARHELRFPSLLDDGRPFAFPCDPDGHVDLDALTPRELQDYLFARTTVGKAFSRPVVVDPA